MDLNDLKNLLKIQPCLYKLRFKNKNLTVATSHIVVPVISLLNQRGRKPMGTYVPNMTPVTCTIIEVELVFMCFSQDPFKGADKYVQHTVSGQ